jgi:hypothetical protein
VADRLASCFPDYADYTANFIEKFIRVSWWRGD